MQATISFPAIDQEVVADPFIAIDDELCGCRIGMIFVPNDPAGYIGDRFVVQLLVRRTAGYPNRPGEMMGGNVVTLSSYIGKRASIHLSGAGTNYTLREMDLKRIEFLSATTPQDQFGNLAWLSFRYETTQLGLKNGPNINERLVDLQWNGAAASPPRNVGSFGLTLANQVVRAAEAASFGPIANILNNAKPVELARLRKETQGAGAIVLHTERDGSNEWLNAVLIQNFGQHDTHGPVPGGDMTLLVNEPIPLNHNTVAAYIVEEVWGACEHLPVILPTQACEWLPTNGLFNKAALDAWLIRSFDGVTADNYEPNAAARVKERVCIRFKKGLQTIGLFN